MNLEEALSQSLAEFLSKYDKADRDKKNKLTNKFLRLLFILFKHKWVLFNEKDRKPSRSL